MLRYVTGGPSVLNVVTHDQSILLVSMCVMEHSTQIESSTNLREQLTKERDNLTSERDQLRAELKAAAAKVR